MAPKGYKIINFKVFSDGQKGGLISFEKNSNVPFDIKRVFYIFGTDSNVSRGCHANRNSEFVLVMIKGSCRVKIDDGKNVDDVVLNNRDTGLYLDKMVWKEMYDFSDDSLLLVLSNQYYDENEYIRDHEQFLSEKNK